MLRGHRELDKISHETGATRHPQGVGELRMDHPPESVSVNAIVVSLLDEFFARLKKSKVLREELNHELRAHRGFLPN